MTFQHSVALLGLVLLASCSSGSTNDNQVSDIDTAIPALPVEDPSDEARRMEQVTYSPIPKDTLLKRVNSSVKIDSLKIRFDKFTTAKQFTFDRYSLYASTEWRYREAERGNKYLVSTAIITSQAKDPNLPCILLYKFEGGLLKHVGTFDYELYRWKDYGTYLGNYHDNGNDFRYTETIKFSIGVEGEEKMLTGEPLFVVLKKEGEIWRKERDLGNPPVSYSSSACDISGYGVVGKEQLNDLEFAAVINKGKL